VRRRAFLRRFRVLVREFLGFQRAVNEDLGPQYMGCPVECTAPNADPYRGCPECKYQIKYKAFQQRTQSAFKKIRGHKAIDDKEWPIDHLISYMTIVMRANGQTRKGYHYSWTVVMAKLIDIYRDETSRVSAIDNWNSRQQMKNFLDEIKNRGSGSSYEEGVE
jgi:hypothetical protein